MLASTFGGKVVAMKAKIAANVTYVIGVGIPHNRSQQCKEYQSELRSRFLKIVQKMASSHRLVRRGIPFHAVLLVSTIQKSRAAKMGSYAQGVICALGAGAAKRMTRLTMMDTL
jgi:hypothetical protein